jgi:hypothetical protein
MLGRVFNGEDDFYIRIKTGKVLGAIVNGGGEVNPVGSGNERPFA